jgi:REP element-mobilizing transposase RayT
MTRPGWHSRGYLLHCDENGLVQHVVFRLADSLPAAALRKTERLGKIERFAKCERLLDAGNGAATLKSPDAAELVVDSLLWFGGQRYALIAWCVMPNHVHVVVEPAADHTLSRIVKSWKAFSAARINELTGSAGRLWAPDYFDRFMRSPEHLATTIAYVENNPVAARLCARPADWPSPRRRCVHGRKMRV